MSSEWKDTEIGLIPEDWDYLPFKKVLAESTRNGIYKSKEYHGKGTRIVNMGEIFAFDRLPSIEMSRIELTEQELNKASVIENDLLFARRSLVAEGAGKCTLVLSQDESLTFESSIIRVRPNQQKANSHYLFYLFKSRIGKYLLRTILRQVAVSGITGTDLVNLKIPLPPPKEQKQIASVLSYLDAKIDNLRRQNETLEKIAQLLFKRWFIDFEFPNEEGNPYKSSGGEMQPSELGDIPKGWRVQPLKKCLKHLIDNRGKTPEFFDSGIPALSAKFVKQGNIINRNNFNYVSLELFEKAEKLEFGDIIMTSEAPLGELYYITNNTNYYPAQRVFALRSNKDVVLSSYLNYFLGSSLGQVLIKRRGTGSTVQGIKQSELNQCEILLTNQMLMKKVSTLFESILVKKESNNQQIQTLTKTRDLLLPKLMSGEIRIKE